MAKKGLFIVKQHGRHIHSLFIMILLYATITAMSVGCGSDNTSGSTSKEYVVRDYNEEELAEIKQELKDNGIENIKVIGLGGQETTETRDMLIVEQSVPAGQMITSGDSITLTVAKVSVVMSEKIAGLPLDEAIEIAHSMGYEDKEIKYYYSGNDNKDVSDTIERETQRDKWIATKAEMQSWSDGVIIYCKHGESSILNSDAADEESEEELLDEDQEPEYGSENNYENEGMTVYVTTYGTHYHYSKDCAGPKSAEISLETAIEHGMEPCSKCVN